jgi:hypothetical protein
MSDRLALVGRPCRRRGAIQCKRQVGACEGAKSEVGGKLASVIKLGLGAARNADAGTPTWWAR